MGFKRRYQNIVEKFLSGDQGKRFFQVFYSLGAAVIIIGVLAKLMHWPHGLGNILLYVGFVTEAIVFTISAFDHPAKDWQWDLVFPVLDTSDANDRPVFGSGGGSGSVVIGNGLAGDTSGVSGGVAAAGVGNGVSGAIILGGGGFGGGGAIGTPRSAVETVENLTPGQVAQSFGIPSAVNISEEETSVLSESIKKMASAADQLSKMSDVLLESYQNIADNTEGLSSSSQNYAEQMDALNRNIQGLSAFYEVQLKSVGSQIESIERINAGLARIKDMYESSVLDSSLFRSETEKMTQQIHALNGVYNRLLNAMTMNMYGTGPAPYAPNPAGFNPNPYNNPPTHS
ncbi:MAG: gliding motility protein GldL [Dysgonamonadaceae bacterium]|jgi:flagellar biosynthesis chaperone FliJ|nr:gliding motility protein GldL [Dysgonamonadaceae bacterium]